MDYQPYEQPQQTFRPNDRPPMALKRSEQMERAAMICGILSLISCMVLYISIPLGALAIILALLSKGGARSVGSKALTGIICGLIGIILTAFLYTVTMFFLIKSYGGISQFKERLQALEGADFNEIYNDIQSHLDQFLPEEK